MSLPEAAIHNLVLQHLVQGETRTESHWEIDFWCGCTTQRQENTWRLCRYHDGMNDGCHMTTETSTQ